LPHLPRFVRTSRNIRCVGTDRTSHTDPLPVGIRNPWCSLDTATHRYAIAVDIDNADGMERADVFARSLATASRNRPSSLTHMDALTPSYFSPLPLQSITKGPRGCWNSLAAWWR
jgi:hypothetical protein